MKKRDYNITRNELISAALPKETATYKPVSHEQLIDLTLESILQGGYKIQKEQYLANSDAQVATGRYTISDIADSEMQIQMIWQNSYNKQVSLKFAIGVNVFVCENGMVRGDMGAFARKHTGDIQEFAPEKITEYIKTAGDVFAETQRECKIMKSVEVDDKLAAELIGRMYIQEQFINNTQMNIIARELKNPTYDYNATNSMWELYQFTTFALKETSPVDWMKNHKKAHQFFRNESGILTLENEFTEMKSPHRQLDWTEEIEKEQNEVEQV